MRPKDVELFAAMATTKKVTNAAIKKTFANLLKEGNRSLISSKVHCIFRRTHDLHNCQQTQRFHSFLKKCSCVVFETLHILLLC